MDISEKDTEMLLERIKIAEELEKQKDMMMDRTYVNINGFEFMVKPVFLGEEREFLKYYTTPFMAIANEDGEITTKAKLDLMLKMFNTQNKSETEIDIRVEATKKIQEVKDMSLFGVLKKYIYKKFGVVEIDYYDGTPAYGLIVWLEKKVYYEGKKIRFSDLERKYDLTKLEIYELITHFLEISNFPWHLPKSEKMIQK